MTPMERYKYVRLKMSNIPDEIIEEYKLKEKATPDGSVYIEIRRGMYGLPQGGLIAMELLEKRLAKHGYRPVAHIPGFWKHDTRPVWFCLTVDDFGVKYIGKQHAKHLLDVLSNYYDVETGDVIRSRGRAWSSVHCSKGGSIHSPNLKSIGSCATTNTNPN